MKVGDFFRETQACLYSQEITGAKVGGRVSSVAHHQKNTGSGVGKMGWRITTKEVTGKNDEVGGSAPTSP